MKWIVSGIIILIVCYYLIHSRGQPKFWKLVSKFPDSAYEYFEQSDNWVVFYQKPEGGYRDALPLGEWDGPFKLTVPQLGGKMVTIYGKVPDYEADQLNIINQFQAYTKT